MIHISVGECFSLERIMKKVVWDLIFVSTIFVTLCLFFS